MQWLSKAAFVAVALAVPFAAGCTDKMASTTAKMSSSSSSMDKMDKDKMMTDKEKMDKDKMMMDKDKMDKEKMPK